MPAPATDTDGKEVVAASLLGATTDIPARQSIVSQQEEMPDDRQVVEHQKSDRAKTFTFKDPKKSISQASPEELLEAFGRADSCSKATLEKMIDKVSVMHKSEQKSKSRAKFFLALLVLLFMVLIGLVAAMWLIVHGSKESHVNSATMVNLQGESVATQSVTSYAELFDLVQFDLKTLLNVKLVNVLLEGNQEVALSISSVSKKRFENTENTTTTESLTLISTGGNKVVIYPTYGTASVKFDGSSYLVKEDHQKRRRLREGLHKARLYSASEWFTEENGFASDGSRRLYASYYSAVSYSTLSTDISSFDSLYDASFTSATITKLGDSSTSWSKSSSDTSASEQAAVKAVVDQLAGWDNPGTADRRRSSAKGWTATGDRRRTYAPACPEVQRRRRRRITVDRRRCCAYWYKQVSGPARRRVLTSSEYAAGLSCYETKYQELSPPATCSYTPGGRLLGATTKAEADNGAGTPQDGSKQSPQQMVQALKDRSLQNSGRFEEPVVSEGFERSLSDKACDR